MKKSEFEIQGEGHGGNGKVVSQIRKWERRATYYKKKLIDSSYDIGFPISKNYIVFLRLKWKNQSSGNRLSYDMKNLYLEIQGKSHGGKDKHVSQMWKE
jgi:hypothetical protein